MKIVVMGTGNIATYLLETIQTKQQLDGEITAIFGRNQEVGETLARTYGIPFFIDFNEFINMPTDIIVEVATVEVARNYMRDVLQHEKDIIISSIGAFKDETFLHAMEQLAEAHRRQIHLPSGAIGGLDLLQSAQALGGLTQVSLTTRKSPASLGLADVQSESVLYKGSAKDAIEQFPKNVNVALLLSIAGIGVDKTEVTVIADPNIQENTHEVKAEGTFGNMRIQIENQPMPNNPKTSYLAALSILSTLQHKESSIRLGS